MALSWNEIKDRALKFTTEWKDETREHAEAKSFWDDFFHVFGITRRRVATFEQPVKKLNETYGFIDLFWKGQLIVEHKSKGKDLDKAYSQALDYFSGLKERDLPKYVLVSDFENFRLYDLDEGTEHNFNISEFYKKIKLFGFIAGYQKKVITAEDPVNIKAAESLGRLHDYLEENGYDGHPLEVFLVRILFCLFADDTSIFEKDIFKEYLETRTNEDGSNLGPLLTEFFQVLNTPEEKRFKNLDESLKQFPYINGRLFEEHLPVPSFNSEMRELLIECSALDWGKISPAIFGSMFQSVMKPEERRNLGAHYTSEKNIMKLIRPLFLDELRQEFEKARGNKRKLTEFHRKLETLKFLDPACGCGNFLIIAYRELRLLEIEVLKELYDPAQQLLTIEKFVRADVDQFYGIEYDEWPARISEVAMWLIDHQMNLKVSEIFGQYFERLPLKKSANIVHGNALRIEWEKIVSKKELSYILGNPPFYGYSYQTKEQKEDMKYVFAGIPGAGVLDYVTAWYVKSAKFIDGSDIKVAFVSTNSISQGEQVGILWQYLIEHHNIIINFAHRTFRWDNEAKGKAAVHVVIIGFSKNHCKKKMIFEYENINEEPLETIVENINPYLVGSKNTIILKRTKPICDVPIMIKGSSPTDGGYLLLDDNEKRQLTEAEPGAEKFIKKYVGSREFINNISRWCLWLKDIQPHELKSLPNVKKRIEEVKKIRLLSKKASTRKWADFPYLFIEERQPDTEYIIIPRVSSEKREYIPIGYLSPDVIVSDSAIALPNADLFIFGVLTSKMHMTWVKYVCGRLKSDYRYSNNMVYNNFPWPKDPDKKNKNKVEKCARAVLDVRAEFPESSLADLYDPLTMPPELLKAHLALDKSVDQCYRKKAFANETERIEYLFERYNEYAPEC
jgi:type I restriction-modification system DNA methylase subunit